MNRFNDMIGNFQAALFRFFFSHFFFFFGFFFLFQHSYDAAQAQIFSGPVSLAMGGSGRAGAESSELLFLNPALVALSTGFEAHIAYRDGAWAPGEHESGYSVTLVENDPDNFSPGGISYVQRRRTSPGLGWREQYFHLALGKSLTPHFTFGLSAFRLDQKLDDGRTFVHWNGSVGTLFTFLENFGVAYVYSNPVQSEDRVPEIIRPLPQQSVGLNWAVPNLIRVTFDVTRWEKLNPHQREIFQVGTEIKVAEFALVRTGYQADHNRHREAITGGIAFNGPRMKANYAIVLPTRHSAGAMHSVDIVLPF